MSAPAKKNVKASKTVGKKPSAPVALKKSISKAATPSSEVVCHHPVVAVVEVADPWGHLRSFYGGSLSDAEEYDRLKKTQLEIATISGKSDAEFRTAAESCRAERLLVSQCHSDAFHLVSPPLCLLPVQRANLRERNLSS
jgi:hypothetical protein